MDKAARAARDQVQSATEKLAAAKSASRGEEREELEEAQGAFEAAEVRAPVAGVIVGRKGEVGQVRARTPATSSSRSPPTCSRWRWSPTRRRTI